MADLVFAYGSLVAEEAGAFAAVLHDFRRCWGVAMNNAVDLPAYKFYLDEAGARPRVYVAFLDLRRSPGESVTGVCLPASPDRLRALDERERNYVRRDVAAHLRPLPAPGVRVWTYVGSPAGRGRLTRGRSAGRAVIDRAYFEAVSDALARVDTNGPTSLDPGDLPVVALERHPTGA